MSWASRRRATYSIGVFLFLAVLLGVPFAWYLYQPPSCSDGKQDQGETDVDKGGPCRLLDERALSPYSVLWSRSFPVRLSGQGEGLYNAVAYIENPNKEAGVVSAKYHFGLYDEKNVLVAERDGTTFIMPGSVTPVFQGGIDTGNRAVAHTYLQFTAPLVWERMADTAHEIGIRNKEILADAAPRLSALAENTSVADAHDLTFVAVVFNVAGNAFAASKTAIARLPAGETQQIVFTWPNPFPIPVGHTDILPLRAPVPLPVLAR